MKLPFLFARAADNAANGPWKYFVLIAHWDLTAIDLAWTNSPKYGGSNMFEPSIDIVHDEDEYEFDDELEALRFLKRRWGEVVLDPVVVGDDDGGDGGDPGTDLD